MLLGPGLRPVAKTTFPALLLTAAAGAVATPAATAKGGGASISSAPSIATIACSSGCAAPRTVEHGGKVTLRGRGLDKVTAVVFLGGRGSRDDAHVRVRARSASRLAVKVPAKARSGRLALVTASGRASRPSRTPLTIVAPAPVTLELAQATPILRPVEGIDALEAGFSTQKAGRHASAATIAYASRASRPVSVRVDIVRVADGLSVFDDERTVGAGEQQTISWDGSAAHGVALDGKYEVRIASGPGSAPRTVAATVGGASIGGSAPDGAAPPPGAASLGVFTFAGAVFPVRGVHDYGQSGARFGASRGGRAHEGHDVMARCGTPVVAARGGIVKQKATHSAAGHYVVISDAATGEDHGYMHFRTPALVERGERVATGQQIGVVGDTGSASACHLHFEIWTAPGWYSGGRPIDPLATLKRWDRLG